MIYCKTLKKEFSSKKEMLQELVANKHDIYRLKCADVIKSEPIDVSIRSNTAEKSSDSVSEKLEIGKTVTNVISTMLYADSHDDVHAIDMFAKSVVEQAGKVFHVVDHDLSIGKIVAYPQDVEMELKTVSWSSLGKPYNGNTQVLLFKSKITDKTNKDAYMGYRDNVGFQHSIRMQYVSIELAVNDPEMKEEYTAWMKYRPLVANGERVDEKGYFFYIKEAKIYREGSTVLFGSNDATPSMGIQTTEVQEPINFTQETKSEDTLKLEDLKSVMNQIFKN